MERKGTILLVGADSGTHSSMAEITLQRYNFFIRTAHSPSDAISWVKHDKPCGILIDCSMDGAEGLAQKLRKKRESEQVCIIGLWTSGNEATPFGLANFTYHGVNDNRFRKPFVGNHLARVLLNEFFY